MHFFSENYVVYRKITKNTAEPDRSEAVKQDLAQRKLDLLAGYN
jgi:hypothetical protein